MFNFEVYAYLFEIKSKIPDFEREKTIRLRRINHRCRVVNALGVNTWSISRIKI